MLQKWFTPARLKWLGLAMIFSGLIGSVWLLSGFRAAKAADCDDNAVIRCGITDEASLQQKCNENANNTQAIFKEFGITCSDLHGLIVGQVTSDNKVYIRNLDGSLGLVGTNAITAGRQKMSGSDVAIAGGAAYKRPPSESFRSSPLTALVKMDGTRFVYAVILSCGNPVIATSQQKPAPAKQQVTPPPPSYEINKTVRLSGQSAWQEEVIAKPDQHVQFQLTIKNTGQTDLNNTVIKDILPKGLTYVDGTFYSNGVKQAANLTTTGVILTYFKAGDTVTMTFEATADRVEACNDNYLTNTGSMLPPNLPPKSDTALVQICKPTEHIKVVKHVTKETKVVEKKELINTGPGSLAGLFAATSVAGTLLYQLRLRRKLF